MNQITLRPALAEDFAFCKALYFDGMAEIIAELGLDEGRQVQTFMQQWVVREVRIIALGGEDIGWLQTAPDGAAVYLGQLFIDRRHQRKGIGQAVIEIVASDAASEGKAVTLGVVKINPARRLYERLGFEMTREDEVKVHMRRAPPTPVPT